MRRLFLYALLVAVLLFTACYATAALDKDLVVYFTFDNIKGKRILDESGNGLDAELLESTKFVKGKYGNAIRITGETEDCVNITAADALEISKAITMMAWVYHEDWIGSSSQWFDKGCYSKDFNSVYGMGVFDEKDVGGAGWLKHGSGMGIILGGEFHRWIIIQNSMKDRT